MRSRWTTSTAIALLSASVLACSDSTGPDPDDLVEVLLDFCSPRTPIFAAYQNEGRDWAQVTPDAAGTIGFQATERFGLALVWQQGADFTTEYLFATPADLEALNGVSCIEGAGSKLLNGSVANVDATSAAMISMADAFAYVEPPASGFILSDLPTGSIDLIAHREVVGISSVVPERIIIRRAQDRVNGSTIPVLDFASSEAQNTAAHTFAASGLVATDDNYYLLTFNTPTTRRHSLSLFEPFGAGTHTVYGVPGALTQAGDWHELEVFSDASATYRGGVNFYRVPANQTIVLGADLNNPTLTTVASSPHLRLRTQLPSQSEYGAFLSVQHVQESRGVEVVITVTNSYYGGTPVTWDVTIPNLSGFQGFPAAARLQSGVATDWFVEAYGGTGGPSAFFGHPSDGATLRYAGRAFTTGARQMMRTRALDRRTPLVRHRGLGAH